MPSWTMYCIPFWEWVSLKFENSLLFIIFDVNLSTYLGLGFFRLLIWDLGLFGAVFWDTFFWDTFILTFCLKLCLHFFGTLFLGTLFLGTLFWIHFLDTFIHFHSLSSRRSVSDHHKLVENAETFSSGTNWVGPLNASLLRAPLYNANNVNFSNFQQP